MVALVAGLAGAAVWRAKRGPASAPDVPAVAPGTGAVPAEQAPAPVTADPRPALLAARATVTCDGGAGEAAFVSPERVIAGLACPEGAAQVRLSDGRELLARALAGPFPGTSLLELPGAAAAYLPPGEASALTEGAPLLVGALGGNPATPVEVTARGLVPVGGLPMLRVEGAPGPLSGPAVDAKGSFVGIAPATPPDPDRPGLLVPAEAFATLLGRSAPPAWTRAAEEAADDERRVQGELWNALRRSPVLLAAGPEVDGVTAVVVVVSRGRPPIEELRLAVDPPARDCETSARIVDWRTGARASDGLPVPSEIGARLARLSPPPGGGSVWIGRGKARLACNPADLAPGATLLVPGSDPPRRVPFPVGAAGAPRPGPPGLAVPGPTPPPPADEDGMARAAAAEEAAAWEIGWRQAFQEANDRLAAARRSRLDVEAQREEARSNLQWVLEQQLDGDVEAARLEEKRAEQALHDLDVRASRAAVPRAWRRSP